MGSQQRRQRTEFSKEDTIHDEPTSVSFGVYSSEEIRKLSVVEINNPMSFNQLGHPVPGGLYDLHMGPFSDKGDMMCAECRLHCEHCPGHLGHITLPLPVCNPLFYNTILRLLKMSCVTCHHFKVEDHLKRLYLVQQELLDHGMVIQAQEAQEILLNQTGGASTGYDEEEHKAAKKALKKTVDSAMVIAKLDKYRNETLEFENEEDKMEIIKNTRSAEECRKKYQKDFLTHGSKTGCCPHCGAVTKTIVFYKSRFIYEGFKMSEEEGEEFINVSNVSRKERKKGEKEKTELNPEEIRNHFRELWSTDPDIFISLFPMLKNKTSKYPTDLFFIETLAVPPPKTRPCQYMSGMMTIHPQSIGLQHVLESVTILKQILQVCRGMDEDELNTETKEMMKSVRGETNLLKMDTQWKELQQNIDHVLDRDMNKGSKGNTWGFKQVIERKTGLFRMNMMGKRVNFAARTVITPDPNLSIDEIGLPEIFAKKLTYRTAVTHWNVEELRQAVINGPDIHPGATYIENESGHRVILKAKDKQQRESQAKTLLTSGTGDGLDSGTKYVHRHLKNGDAMLLNRQPTLHKPSIMSHRARVLKGHKVMRLHYAICKSYNADFDGDEMNAHFPQNEVARSEAYNIVNVCKQYLVPKDGTPLQGLIQDHIIAGVKMSMRGRFFTRAEYQQFVYYALVEVRGKIKTLPPCIVKPSALWSGKQIISTIIINLVPEGKPPPTLSSKAKIKGNEWEKAKPRPWRAGGTPLPQKMEQGPTMCESEVIFSHGEMLSGILDKNQYGATQYSLVHAFFELYGGTYSGKLLSAFSKIFTNFLHTEGFTLGVRDILVKSDANESRKKIMQTTRQVGRESAADGVGLFKDGQIPDEEDLDKALESAHRESKKVIKRRMDIDRAYKERLSKANNKINSVCMPKGLVATFPYNNLQLMVQAGAKGSSVNTMQISCLLGQIELEGKRPPLMISGKPLPSFQPYDKRPRAGGFIDGRFMTGIKPQEFFYHCMAGREGLIDTAVKTSRSGYLQRCLIKLLEGLVVNYDQTVRDSCDGSVIQFQYGEDGLDVCKSQYLKSGQLDFMTTNKDAIYDPKAVKMAKNAVKDPEGLEKYKQKIEKAKSRQSKIQTGERTNGFLKFCEKLDIEERSDDNEISSNTGRILKAGRLEKAWRDYENKSKYEKKAGKLPDPVTCQYRADSNFGSVTEQIDAMIEGYKGPKDATFKDMMYTKFMHAMVDAGEPVGVLAAQSVGEPSTQMTLNTFHFAGRGDMNVTLGIPRLREILMVASKNIKTPSMTIPFLPHVSEKKKDKFRISLNKVTVANLLEAVHVNEKIDMNKGSGSRRRLVRMRFEFLPHKSYKDKYAVTPPMVLKYFENTYIGKKFLIVLSSVIKDKIVDIETNTEKKSKKSKKDDDDPDAEDGNTGPDKTMDQLEKGGFGEGHASSDEEELADDADATESRKKQRQQDQDFNEGLSDEEVDLVKDLDRELGDDPEDMEIPDWDSDPKSRPVSRTENDEGIEDMESDDDDNENAGTKYVIDKKTVEQRNMENNKDAQKRKVGVLSLVAPKGGHASIVDYIYDTEKEEWCELTLAFPVGRKTVDISNVIRKSAEKSVIRCVKNISRAFLIKNNKDENVLTTEGANIEAMFAHENILDLKKLHCNNIHDMAQYYGIEAANKTIVYEIVNVFSAYGITVNPRHLSLIADYMTFDGTYKPFNRIGIADNPSPFQQMTFETAVGFLRSATLGGKSDTLDSPSSCIVMGKPFCGGTGTFQVRQSLLAANVTEQNF